MFKTLVSISLQAEQNQSSVININCDLTPCGLLAAYGDIDLG